MADIVIMPKLGFDMAEGTLVRWVIAEGGSVAKGVVLAEIETDKATVEVESTFSGIVAHHLVQQGDIVPVNTPIAVIGAPGEAIDLHALGLETAAAATPAPKEKFSTPGGDTAPVETVPAAGDENFPDTQLPAGLRISPLARRMAKERNLDLRKVKGSGPGGRIVKADIEAYQELPAAAGLVPQAAGQATPSAPLPTVFEPKADTYVPLSRLRSAIGRRMVDAKQHIPHFYITHDFNMAAVMDLRKQINALLPDDEKVSVNDFVVKAVALALRTFPNLNASLDDEKNQIIHHGNINVGVAVAVENGLLTVVCRNANQKPLRQIAIEVRSLAVRARDGKVRPEDVEGSTFSISNLGMFDVEDFVAIINPPEAAILAVGSVHDVPVVENGELRVGVRMKATISVDHRVSDGAEAARFLQELAKYLETPLYLML